MANEEAFTLDSLALNDGITFGVTAVSWPPPRQRQDWIGAADSEAQLLFRNPLHDNRKVTLKIAVITQSTMDLALAKIAQVLDKLQKASRYTDGIGLVWTPATATLTCTFDVLSGEITDLPVDWENGWLSKSPEFTVELTCKPYWRGTETLTSTASSSTPFVTLEVASVTGDVPALGRIIITDTATQSRRHVEWGLEGPLTYNSATSLLVDSDSMVTSGFSGSLATTTGSYDPNAAGVNSISATLFANTVAAICGTGNLSHVGSFRVKARVQFGSPQDSARLSWTALDAPTSANTWVLTQKPGFWEEIDLGTISIPAATLGTQRWTGQLDAVTTRSGGSTIIVDYLTLVPVTDGYGKARATFTQKPGLVVSYDDFTSTTSGSALSGRVGIAGGTWATSGDATDYAFADLPTVTDETIKRSASSGTLGRIALLGTGTPTDVQVQAAIFATTSPAVISTALDQAVIARYVDANNYLYATYRRTTTSSTTGPYPKTFEIRQMLAGVDTQLASVPYGPISVTGITSLVWLTINLLVYSTGVTRAQLLLSGAEVASVTASSSVLATAGPLASGKSGILDRNTSATSIDRYYDAFTVFTPAAEPIVLYSGRNMQVRYDDTLRQDSTGTYSGRTPSYRGSRFLVPVGTSRVLVKARRNDIEAAVDDQVTDATQIQVGWTPRGLAVPR